MHFPLTSIGKHSVHDCYGKMADYLDMTFDPTSTAWIP